MNIDLDHLETAKIPSRFKLSETAITMTTSEQSGTETPTKQNQRFKEFGRSRRLVPLQKGNMLLKVSQAAVKEHPSKTEGKSSMSARCRARKLRISCSCNHCFSVHKGENQSQTLKIIVWQTEATNVAPIRLQSHETRDSFPLLWSKTCRTPSITMIFEGL